MPMKKVFCHGIQQSFYGFNEIFIHKSIDENVRFDSIYTGYITHEKFSSPSFKASFSVRLTRSHMANHGQNPALQMPLYK